MNPFSIMGKVVSFVRNIRERLILSVPVVDAHCLPPSRLETYGENFYLIRVNIHPAARQSRFDRISAERCRIIKATLKVAENGSQIYVPDWSKGILKNLECDIVVPSERETQRDTTLLFFVEPRNGIKKTTIKLHSPYFLMSVSCDVKLTHLVEGPEFRFM